jgi:hypothetical protein
MFSEVMFISSTIGRPRSLPLLLSALCLLSPNVVAQNATSTSNASSTPAQIIFQLDFPGQQTPHYEIMLAEDGRGSYDTDAIEAQDKQPMSFSIGAADAAPLFALARQLQFFHGEFAASRKVAFMGTKSLRYIGPDGSGQTTFTYTENKKLEQLTTNLQSLALTLQMGQQLLADSRFNRMAVNQDMVELKDSLRRHTAAYPQAIAPVLAVIVDDAKVIAPARRDATTILQSSGPVN